MSNLLSRLWAFNTPPHGGSPGRGDDSERAAVRAARGGASRDNETLLRELGGQDAWKRVPGALGGVALIARIAASVPVHLAEREEDGSLTKVVPGTEGHAGGKSAFARLLRRPNRHQSPFQFFNCVFSQLKAYGNVYLWIKPGALRELYILNGDAVDVRLNSSWHKEYRYKTWEPRDQGWVAGLPRHSYGGRQWFLTEDRRAGHGSGFLGVDGTLARPLPGREHDGKGYTYLRDAEVIHITDHTINQLVGISPVGQLARTFGLQAAIEIIASEWAAVGGRKPIIVAARDPATPHDKLEDARIELENRANFQSSVFVAGGDFSVQELGTGMDNMDETKMSNNTDIGRAFGIPPSYNQVEGQAGSSKGAEEQTRTFLTMTIMPLQRAVGDALRDGLYPEWHGSKTPVEVVWDNSELTKASLIARSQHYVDMLTNKTYTPNEVRKMERMEPIEGGDELLDPAMLSGGMGRPNTDGSGRSDTEKSNNTRKDGGREGPRKS